MGQSLALEEAFERALGAIPARVLLGGVAVAYSGGLDSTVLLKLAVQWARDRSLPVHALHVHHGLSPNAEAWAMHCQQSCAALGIPCQVLRVAVQTAGEGLEQAARKARYQALFAACKSAGAHALLTAHHLNDQAETVLLNLLRGAGVAGLAGMHAQSLRQDAEGVHVLRPLLDQPRAELEAWARTHALAWVEDESNQALHLRRNLVRNVLLPSIEAHFPAAPSVLARSASHFHDAQKLLDQLAGIDLQAVSREEGAALDVQALSALPPERIDNLLRHWLRLHAVHAPSSAQLEDLRTQVLNAAPDRQPEIRYGDVVLRRTRGVLVLSCALPDPPREDIVLQWSGEARIPVPAWHGTLLLKSGEAGELSGQCLAGCLRISPRKGGERLRLQPQAPSRSLKNLYQEAAIPAWQRPFLPLVFCGEDLVFAAGLGMNRSRPTTPPGADLPGFDLVWQSDLQFLPSPW